MGAPRKCDHVEVRLLYREVGVAETSRRLGISKTRVYQIVNPEYGARAHSLAVAWKREGRCPDCGAPATRQTLNLQHRCQACASIALSSSARTEELRCVTCRKWKPDNAFAHTRSNKYGRRGRHHQCTACNTAARRAYREAHAEAQRAYDREYKRRKRQVAA